MKGVIKFLLLTILFWSGTYITGGVASPVPHTSTAESRSAETCADPSQTITMVQGFNIGQDAYALAPVAGYTAGISSQPNSEWVYQGEVFLAWDASDPSLTPFYRSFNPTTTDYISQLAPNNNPPPVAGFEVQGILGYVYATQVCGSVPLLGASNAAVGSHYYTTQANDHAQLVGSSGWADDGTVAFVLPLSAGAW